MGADHLYDASPQEQRPGSSGGAVQQLNGPSGFPSDPRAGFNQPGGPPRGPLRVGTAGHQPPGSMPSPPSASAGGGSPASRAAAATFGPPLPANRPSFASPLQTLYERDGTPVPIVVHQCIQAVDLYGLKVDGIYRVSGTSAHIARLRQMFDNDPANVDFSNPENFFHDINSVTGLLKQFFRDLPGGLLTEAFYRDFIQAAKIEDADQRRDALHATINSLPDSNYATLRSLCLHLWRVQEHEATNRMTSANLAICFGPTLLVPANSRDLADAGWQVKAMETVFANTMQIFDED
jgi:Rho GTPase-activating protein RGD1